MDDVRNVIIIGSGPAGYTAAIYAARADLAPLVLDGSVTAGGALMNTTDVENFPGFPDGVMGPDLMDHLRRQAERFGAELVTDDVTAVDLTGPVKVVTDGAGAEHRARRSSSPPAPVPRARGVPHEKRLSGRGVSWCATCDGFFFRDQDIAVVGGGDSAMEEATFLTRFARSVTIVHRRDSCAPPRSCRSGPSPTTRSGSSGTARSSTVLGENKVGRRARPQHATGEESELDVTGLFVAIGHDPRSELFADQVRRDDEGYILVDAPTTQTNLAGVFACGDVVDHIYRQAVTAAGTGCAAALDAERYLASLDDEATGDPTQVAQAAAGRLTPDPWRRARDPRRRPCNPGEQRSTGPTPNRENLWEPTPRP